MVQVHIEADATALAAAAARLGAEAIRAAVAARGAANIVVATGASQFETLAALVREPGIDWARVTGFHLDEYAAFPETHPASFRRYLKERFTSQLPTLGAFHFIKGDAADLDAEMARLDALIARCPIDVTFAGIGENAHLAFNDPPAEFETAKPFHVVTLEERCRRQQFGEGWFAALADVPHKAVTMSVPQIMRSGLIVLAVPDRRKAEAVRDTLEGTVTPMVPASIMRRHGACHVFLDPASAALLQNAAAASEA